MTKKIFRSILFTSLAVLLVSLTVAVGCLYYYFGTIQKKNLKTELALTAQAVQKVGSTYIDDLETDDLRFTLVDGNGNVLSDTYADPETIENYKDREEISEALTHGSGKSYRYSSTLTEKTIYYTMLLDNGNVLRVSASQKTVFALIAGIIPWFIFAVLLAALLSWMLAKQLARKIIEPLEQVIDGLRDEIKSRHIDRLRDGRCTIELGFILCDILTNYERVSDHCSNLAACLIKSAEQSFETHKFLSEMKDPSNTEYKSEYENFGKKYAI